MGKTKEICMKLTAAKTKGLMGKHRWPTAWSHSRYASWRLCPLAYFLNNICKIPQPPIPAMERGIKIHKLAEEFLKGNIRGMPKELAKFTPELKRLQRLGVIPEAAWNITPTGESCNWNDWNRVWLRAKIDAHHYFEDTGELIVIDFKTGRYNVTKSQMDLYAWLGPYFYPDVQHIVVELWFLDHGETASEEYELSDIKHLNTKWRKRADGLLSARTFEGTPNWTCKRCPFRSDNVMLNGKKGPCTAWKKA